MAFPIGVACVPVAFPAAVPGRLARRRRLRLCDPESYGRAVAAIPGNGVHLCPACLLRGAGDHAVARDQGCQAPSGCDGGANGLRPVRLWRRAGGVGGSGPTLVDQCLTHFLASYILRQVSILSFRFCLDARTRAHAASLAAASTTATTSSSGGHDELGPVSCTETREPESLGQEPRHLADAIAGFPPGPGSLDPRNARFVSASRLSLQKLRKIRDSTMGHRRSVEKRPSLPGPQSGIRRKALGPAHGPCV